MMFRKPRYRYVLQRQTWELTDTGILGGRTAEKHHVLLTAVDCNPSMTGIVSGTQWAMSAGDFKQAVEAGELRHVVPHCDAKDDCWPVWVRAGTQDQRLEAIATQNTFYPGGLSTSPRITLGFIYHEKLNYLVIQPDIGTDAGRTNYVKVPCMSLEMAEYYRALADTSPANQIIWRSENRD